MRKWFSFLSKRSSQTEIIDQEPNEHTYTLKEYIDCLEKLDRIGRWLGGDRANLKSLSKMAVNPSSIIDIGCGGGLFDIRLEKKFPEAHIIGIDLNPYAIQFANTRKPSGCKVDFELRELKELNEPHKSYDVVISTLVCHHIPEDELVNFISQACQVAKCKVILNDLHRHPLAWLLFKWIAPIFFRNRLVLHDGLISVERSFKRKDWIRYLEKAKIDKSRYRITWYWAFRWIVEIDCEGKDD